MRQNEPKIGNIKDLSVKTINKNKNLFNQNSVITLKGIVSKKLIDESLDFLQKEELKIIKKYCEDKRGLVIENIENKNYIKYFEHPLALNFSLFGRFLTSNLINCCEELLEDRVYLRSVEIHCRNPGGTSIPMHQDNAYYGLKNGKACTIFIPLNKTLISQGDLTYITNKVGNEYSHNSSNESAFSLEINQNDKKKLKKQNKIHEIDISDAFVHHSHSVHYADEVPIDSTRTWAVRITLFGLADHIKVGHQDWYNEVVKRNRKNARI